MIAIEKIDVGGAETILWKAELQIEIPNRFVPFFATSDPPCSTTQNTLERAFIKLIPHLDVETLEEILRTAAAARLTKS